MVLGVGSLMTFSIHVWFLNKKRIEIKKRLSHICKLDNKSAYNLVDTDFWKALEDHNIDLANRALKSGRMEERFLRTISDDVRTPVLRIMEGIRELSQLSKREAERSILADLRLAAFKILGTINDALEIGKPSIDDRSELRSVDFSQIASDISEIYSANFGGEERVSLCVLVDHRLPKSVLADPKSIMHLIGNLIENAIRFSKGGEATVAIRCVNTEAKRGEKSKVIISCSDTGAGISKDRLERIHAELSPHHESVNFREVGLGLRAVQNIALQYKGSFRLTSNEGEGTKAAAELEFEVEEPRRVLREIPKTFGFATTSKEVFMIVGKVGFFHGIRPVPVSDPASDQNQELIFVDGYDLCLERFGPVRAFKSKDRCVVLLRIDQFKIREKLIESGFKRFITFPMSSTSLLQCLAGEDQIMLVQPRKEEATSGVKLKILVVDDVATTRLRICDYIKSLGHTISEASDGIELVERVNGGESFDLIITDLTMNHLDGIPAVKQIRESEKSFKRKRVPIIAMTAYSSSDDTKSLVEHGFDAVLKKPIYLDELSYLIQTVISSPGGERVASIDIDDLNRRSSGKSDLMKRVLESFIAHSEQALNELHAIARSSNDTDATRPLHALKGLLLEVGAKEHAETVSVIEKRVKTEGALSETNLSKVTGLVQDACSDASCWLEKK